ncbi:MAG TPA: nuclear transport factor 2 family protein [Rhizomicrobium sp.]|jgi:hypothetical protein|nr:nuclear transport factor 2 family protein [Rhizomicrobium sp.]
MRALVFVCLAIVPSLAARADEGQILQSRMQSLMDAVGTGDAKVWSATLDKRFVMIDETGAISDYAQSVAQVQPLPKGVSGSIAVTEWKATIFGDVAVATHLDDEHEDFHGQKLHALYRSTSSWLKQNGQWKLISMQTLALRQDPPAVSLPDRLSDEYVGRYRAAPDYVYEIMKRDGTLYGATNGGKPVELKAELADVLFTPGQPRTRKIFVRDAQGRIVRLLSRREERDVVFTKEK